MQGTKRGCDASGILLHRKAKSTIRQQIVFCQNNRKNLKFWNMKHGRKKQFPLTVPKFRQRKSSSNINTNHRYFFPNKIIIRVFVIAEVHELFLEILPYHQNQCFYFSLLSLKANTGKVIEFISTLDKNFCKILLYVLRFHLTNDSYKGKNLCKCPPF